MRAERAPLQNRVDPFGALCAVDARGLFMGNRGGRIHRDDRTLGTRRHASRQWICCVCDFKGRQRTVWGAGYTELFFLDEVTALAAGHRPCFECRRRDAVAFQAAFPSVDGNRPRADVMDRLLHAQRLAGRTKRTHPYACERLPDGAMIAIGDEAFALRGAKMLRWTHYGYDTAQPRIEGNVEALTPPGTIAALRGGYSPQWHDTALVF